MKKRMSLMDSDLSDSIFSYFDGVLIINLPHRADRRRQTELELMANGFYDLKKYNIEFFTATRPESLDGFLKIGSRGSLISHLNAIVEARSRGYKSLLLLEDDVKFTTAIKDPEFLARLSNTLKHDWDLLYFGSNVEEYKVSEPTRFLYWSSELMLSHCLAINSTIFDDLILHLQQVLERPLGHPLGGKVGFDPSMNLFRQQFQVATYVVAPPVAFQRSSKTDLGHEKWFDNVPILRSLAKAYRSLRVVIDRRTRLG